MDSLLNSLLQSYEESYKKAKINYIFEDVWIPETRIKNEDYLLNLAMAKFGLSYEDLNKKPSFIKSIVDNSI
jgi:hypothetical protein